MSISIPAYHEAAHALVALLVGLPFDCIVLDDSGGGELRFGGKHSPSDWPRAHALIALAGAAATAHVTGGDPHWHAAKVDRAQAKSIVVDALATLDIKPVPEVVEHIEAKYLKGALDLTRRYWSAIEGIASVLEATRKVDHECARLIFERRKDR